MMILSHFLWGKGGREEGGKDMQETSLTAQDWKRQSKQVQADMYALLDRLDGGEMEPEASRAAREQLHEYEVRQTITTLAKRDDGSAALAQLMGRQSPRGLM